MTLKFTKDHDWLRIDGDIVTVGITDHAAKELGDLVFVQLPKVGAKVTTGAAAVVVESVKTAYDVLSPIDGVVTEINQTAVDDPAMVSAEPQAGGWLYKVKVANAAALDDFLDEADYQNLSS